MGFFDYLFETPGTRRRRELLNLERKVEARGSSQWFRTRELEEKVERLNLLCRGLVEGSDQPR